MPIDAFNIRRLRPEDAAIFRMLRLEGLLLAPHAFGSTHAVEAARPDSAFADRLETTAVFAAFVAAEPLGLAGFYAMQSEKEAHKGVLWGMYVREAARGSAVAAALVQAVLDHAGGAVEQVLLSVQSENVRARRLYERLGFQAYGTEPRALRQDGSYFDEVLMVKFLT